jgi:hypothetical protein
MSEPTRASACPVVLKRRGKIFVMLVGDGVVLKLPKNRVDELVASPARKRKRSITPGVTRRDACTDGISSQDGTSPDQIMVYKSVGVAAEDDAAAALVLRRARERGVGRQLDL